MLTHESRREHQGLNFLDASDAFVTFLYAAAVHLLIAHAVEGESLTGTSAAVVLFLVLFIFSDWLSRVRLPRLIPDPVKWYEPLGKALLEIGGLFFLVIAFLLTIDAQRSHLATPSELIAPATAAAMPAYQAFAFFLSFTFLWNLLMLRVMTKLDWTDLAIAAVNGSAIDLEKGKDYAQQFWQIRERLQKIYEDSTGHNHEMGYVTGRGIVAITKLALAASILQLLFFHIAFTGVVAAGIFLLCSWFAVDTSLLVLWSSSPSAYPAVAHTLLDTVTWVHSVTSRVPVSMAFFAAVCLVLLPFRQSLKRSFWPSLATASIALQVVTYWLAHSLSADLNSYIASVVLVLILPAIPLWLRELYKKECHGKRMCGAIAGVLTFSMPVLIYSSVKPIELMILVALQQIFFSSFLQFAATHTASSDSTCTCGKCYT